MRYNSTEFWGHPDVLNALRNSLITEGTVRYDHPRYSLLLSFICPACGCTHAIGNNSELLDTYAIDYHCKIKSIDVIVKLKKYEF